MELRGIVNPLRVTTASDVIAFKLLVNAIATARRAAALLREEGITVTEVGPRGPTTKVHPAAAVVERFMKIAFYGLGRFGCTPGDRSRVGVVDGAGSGPGDPDSEFSA
jgi:hypothetical protein